MSAKQVLQLRRQAFKQQHECCYYCQFPIWEANGKDFCRAYKVSRRVARQLRCTAEHLIARQDNGPNTLENIVAACFWCNQMRHRGRHRNAPDAASYKQEVARLVRQGRWHPWASYMASTCNVDLARGLE